MPDHSDEHMQRLAGISASRRRASKIARLIDTAPPLEVDQVSNLHTLLDSRVVESGAGAAVAAAGTNAQGKQTQLDEVVKQIVDAAPPLTAEQRDRLAVLLREAGVPS